MNLESRSSMLDLQCLDAQSGVVLSVRRHRCQFYLSRGVNLLHTQIAYDLRT